jgi:hypothetical protein
MNPAEEPADPEAVEAAARANGWVPPDEWKSDKPPPGGFVSAAEFERRGNEIRPVMHHRLKKQDDELSALRAEIAGVREAARKFEHFSNAAVERERREKEYALQQLEARRAQAITDGDGQTAVQAEKQIRAIEQAPAPSANPPPPQMDPVAVDRFLKENAWYGTDKVMRNWAEGRSKELLATGTPPGEAILAAIHAEARVDFPERFARPSGTSTVEGNGRRQPTSYGRTFDDLPSDAKAAFEEFKRAGVTMTKQQYLANYEWE